MLRRLVGRTYPRVARGARNSLLLATCVSLPAVGCGDDGGSADDGAETGDADSGPADEGSSSEAGTEEGGSSMDGTTTGDGDGDGDGTTTGDGDGDGGPDGWNFEDVYGVPNLDDDDSNGKTDWLDPPGSSDDDLSTITIGASQIEGFASGDQVRLVVQDGASEIRIWMSGSAAPVVGNTGSGTSTSYTFDPSGSDQLQIEFEDYLARATLTLEHIDSGGAVVENATITLMASPMILNHHLQPAEHVYVTQVNSNGAMVSAYQSVLGSAFTPVPGGSVGYDVWIQDEVEFATSLGANGVRLDTVIDSIRDRGLDAFAENYFDDPNWYIGTWGTKNQQSTYDSFGNLEVTPPLTAGGVEYPFGRIYYGAGMHSGMVAQLVSQRIQDPLEVDTGWLCVGHVDEFSSFVADPSSEKGFKLLLADTTAGYAILNQMDPNISLSSKYGADYGYPTVKSIQDDSNLETLNKDLQTDEIDPIRAQFKAEFGLTDDDIIEIPTIFERAGFCNNRVAALIPGTVNLVVANMEGDDTTLFVPDPFMRENGQGPTQDPFAVDFANRMPEGNNVTFVDNWDTYHVALGEVHCGTNVIRTPIANWWEKAMHLLQ